MPDEGEATLELLRRWRTGDQTALHALLERDLPWIRAQVHRRLGGALVNDLLEAEVHHPLRATYAGLDVPVVGVLGIV